MTTDTPVNDRIWTTIEVLAMSCSIFRNKGFTSTSTIIAAEPDSDLRWTNKDHLCYQLVPHLADSKYLSRFSVTDADLEEAESIIKHFRRLSFGVIGDNINDYMKRVFAATQNDTVKFQDFGVIASIPHVYQKEIIAKEIKTQVKDTVQEHIGKIGDTVTLNIRYIETRYIPKLNCFGHSAITDTNHLVNFLNKIELGKPGTTQKIRARVKAHGANYVTKTLETQLNYVKAVDTILVWQ